MLRSQSSSYSQGREKTLEKVTEAPEIESYSPSYWSQTGGTAIMGLELNSLFSPVKCVKLIATFSPRSL